jgi:hypothetical protein
MQGPDFFRIEPRRSEFETPVAAEKLDISEIRGNVGR